ncbi:MAG: HAD family hydrolase [Patescibacteria group bacterium]
MMQPKPILFCDFDGVLSHDKYWRSLPAKQLQKVQELIFLGDGKLVGEWMRGKHTAEDINTIVSEHLNISYSHVWDVFVNDCSTMHVSINALQKLHSLRERFTVILITTNMDSFSRFTAPSHNLKNYFDHIFNSFNEGMLKTDNNGEPYVKLSEQYNVPIADCIVFDDSKSVCDIFNALGGKAYLVTKENDLEKQLLNL